MKHATWPLAVRTSYVFFLAIGATSGCYRPAEVCQPACGDRVCGPDPACGLSCGACPPGQACTPQGQCRNTDDGEPDAGDGPDGGPDAGDAGDGSDAGPADAGPDAGDDPGQDAGPDASEDAGEDPCADLEPDCFVPASYLNPQGPDRDKDGWGVCCDCDDTRAAVHPMKIETVDGEDDNCNGLVDEPGGLMVPVPNVSGVWIDAYEISVYDRPDCSGTRYGELADDYPAAWPAAGDATVELYACSRPGVLPSAYLSRHRAERACQAVGKRLCSRMEWMSACRGGRFVIFPYGANFRPGICNDAWGGAGQSMPAGSYESCTAEAGTWDMSGNLAEWVANNSTTDPDMALAGGFHFACELCDWGQDCIPCTDSEDDRISISHASDCDIGAGDDHEGYPPEMVRETLGARCCYDF